MKQEGDTSKIEIIPGHLLPAFDEAELTPGQFLDLAMGHPSIENPIVQNPECSRARAASIEQPPFQDGGAVV